MNDAMRRALPEIAESQLRIARLREALEPVCDHRDESGEKAWSYDENLDQYYCIYCGHEWGLSPP